MMELPLHHSKVGCNPRFQQAFTSYLNLGKKFLVANFVPRCTAWFLAETSIGASRKKIVSLSHSAKSITKTRPEITRRSLFLHDFAKRPADVAVRASFWGRRARIKGWSLAWVTSDSQRLQNSPTCCPSCIARELPLIWVDQAPA